MATVKSGYYSSKNTFDDQLCAKISIAIKKSNVYAHINPSDLILKRYSDLHSNSLEDSPPPKKLKESISLDNSILENRNTSENVFSLNFQLKNFLPDPETFFEHSTPKSKTVKTECTLKGDNDIARSIYMADQHKNIKIFAEDLRTPPNTELSVNKSHNVETREKSPKREINREKQNLDLSNLATTLLPLPNQLFGKDTMLAALECGNYSDFMSFFKEGIQIENEISNEDLIELMDMVIKKKAFNIIPEFLSCLKNINNYIEVLSNFFDKNEGQLKNYENDIMNCMESMIDFKAESIINLFIKTCVKLNRWNQLWTVITQNRPDYVIPEEYFESCMDIFSKFDDQKHLIEEETLMKIISYINRNYYSKKKTYSADVWFYCMYHDINNKDLNSMLNIEASQEINDIIIGKLKSIREPSFIFGMKMLSHNWNLIFNHTFCEWFSKLISDKSDVRKCLYTVKDSVSRTSKQDIFDCFYLLGIRVMFFLNKKSLFTCSKSIYENFLKNYFLEIKRALLKVEDKFKLKWTMVECLISSAEYEKALCVIKEFEVLKDLEATSRDYNKVKEKLPNLVWHLLNSSQLLPVIVLFEEVVSIFIFNESIDSAYTKNCNEIFDLIVVKAYESNDSEVIKKMISLLDLILSANIDFEISKESLRYLAVGAVRSSVPFKELLDFVDTCFKFNIFEKIQTSEDGYGSYVNADSDLTYEEIVLLITWMCRHVKINLVQSVQNQGSSIRENIMKVCSIKFLLHSSTNPDSFCKDIGVEATFNEFLDKFTEALNNPKYLTHPIKFSTISDTGDNAVKIICDNRIVYNTVYYSDI